LKVFIVNFEISMSPTIELGLNPYPLYDSATIFHRNRCEPGGQLVEFFESLLQVANLDYSFSSDLIFDDERVLLFRWRGVKCALIRLIGPPVNDFCIKELISEHEIEVAFVPWPTEKQMQVPNVYALPFSFGYKLAEIGLPVSWELYDWSQYNVNYTAGGNLIATYLVERHFPDPENIGFGTYRAKCSNALERVIASGRYTVDRNWKTPMQFMNQVNDIFLAVPAVGMSPHQLDRYPMQLMAVGCACVMPETTYPMPGGPLVPGVHYVKCRDDFKDLLEVIDSCSKSYLMQVGNNARNFFKRNMTPVPLCRYIDNMVQRYITGSLSPS